MYPNPNLPSTRLYDFVKTFLLKKVRYTGPAESILEGQKWSIDCHEPPGNQVEWRKNDQEISQLKTGEIAVGPLKNGTSTISSGSAKEEHAGKYQCSKGNDSFTLEVKSGS